MERPKYPVGIQTFSEIINNDYVYVDKTEYVYRLATRGTDRYVYVMKFKLNGTPEEAMAQIREKEYTLPFLNDGREIILIGANFSNTTRRPDRWIIEKL